METTQQVAAEQGSPRKGVTGGTNIGFIKIDWEFFWGGGMYVSARNKEAHNSKAK